jgi:hypothetical protein
MVTQSNQGQEVNVLGQDHANSKFMLQNYAGSNSVCTYRIYQQVIIFPSLVFQFSSILHSYTKLLISPGKCITALQFLTVFLPMFELSEIYLT